MIETLLSIRGKQVTTITKADKRHSGKLYRSVGNGPYGDWNVRGPKGLVRLYIEEVEEIVIDGALGIEIYLTR
jgi:hypothetical protein